MPERPLRGLYLVTPDEPDTDHLVALLEQALAGRPALVQYRNKQACAARRREQAGRIADLCRDARVPLVVNDDLELALEVGADGLHLGRDDGDPGAARHALGPARLLGVSCYDDWSRAQQACAAGADYVAFGAMFASSTKPDAVRAPLQLLARARNELGIAVAAIGGITLAGARQLVAEGADLVAVISDVFDAPDPAARVVAYQQLFAHSGASGPLRGRDASSD